MGHGRTPGTGRIAGIAALGIGVLAAGVLIWAAIVLARGATGLAAEPDTAANSPSAGEAAATAADPLAAAVADFNRGSALLEQYRYAEAAKVLQKVVDSHGEWGAARFNLALACLNTQDK